MKICLISEAGAYHTQRWARGLSEEGCELHLISSQNAAIPSVHLHHLPIYSSNLISKIINNLRVRNTIQKLSPDVVHLFGLFSVSSLINMFIVRNLKNLVISVWGSDVINEQNKADLKKDYVKSYLLAHGRRIIATSQFLAAETRKYCKFHQRVDTLPWGVDLTIFKPGLEKKASDTITVGFAKRLHELAGPDTLLKAFRLAQNKSKKKLVLNIAGDGPMKQCLKQLADKLGLNKSIQWSGWFASDSELGKFYRKMDVYAMPSRREAFGLAAAEAAASGVPVVAFKEGGIPEIVLDGQTGCLVPPRDVDKFGDALAYLADNDKVRTEMGIQGRNRAQELFDWEVTLASMVKIYEQVKCN